MEYSENRIKDWKELRRALEALELDEGIRIDLKNEFIFINKLKNEYPLCISEKVYDKALKKYIPTEDKEWHSFKSLEELLSFLKERVKEPIEAWLY
ncbi:MAG: hypothetical protein QXX95_01840 [Nitrososphaerales archaeon]